MLIFNFEMFLQDHVASHNQAIIERLRNDLKLTEIEIASAAPIIFITIDEIQKAFDKTLRDLYQAHPEAEKFMK